MDEVSLSQNEFKALASKSRTNILKILQERNYTLSELAVKTDMAAPTVKQHTAILMESDLIELQDEGRKWKYYSLTRKGRKILDSKKNNTNIFIVLSSVGVIALLGLAIVFSGNFLPTTSLESAIVKDSSGDMTSIIPAPEREADIPTLGAIEEVGEAEFRCRPLFEVETNDPNPGITASEAYSQDCFLAQDKESCEKVDVYSKETQTFGDQDGIPDCEWVTAKFGE